MDVTTLDYLTALYGNCDRGDIVFVGHTRNYVTGHFPVTEREAAAAHVASRPLDLFIKVNPMNHQQTLSRSLKGIGGEAEVEAIVSFHLDVDAGEKNDQKYISQAGLLDALGKMPLAPSLIVLSDGDDLGFHVYWLLSEPHYITDMADRKRCGETAQRWLEELREHVKSIDKKATVDGTANIDRLLRPIGAKRKSGNTVKALKWNPERRYNIEDFDLPALPQPFNWNGPAGESKETYEGESVIEKYLDTVGLTTVESILIPRGYTEWKGSDRFLIRPGSSSGMYTGEIFTKDGMRGFTVKSGGAEPLSNVNKKGTNGKWYSVPMLWVAFEHKDDWKKAAAFCHEYFESLEPKVDFSGMDDQPLGPSGQPRGKPHTEQTDQPKQPEPNPQPQPEKPKEKRPDPPTTRAAKLAVDYLQRINAGELPQLLPQRAALSGIEIGPGLVTPIGAPPGFGKTALAMQIMFDSLELDHELRAVVANAETSFDVLLRRELTRRTRIKSNDIRFGRLAPHDLERINAEIGELIPRLQRVDVLNDPCSLVQLLRLKDEAPGLVVVDYLQKFSPTDKDARQGVNEVMAGLRGLAKLGWSVLCLSATKRDANGRHDSKELSLSSFRESGEVEYNADSAYVLRDNGPVDNKPYIRHITLGHVKNRHGEKKNHELRFHMPRMEFTAMPKDSPLSGDFDEYCHDSLEEAEAF